MKRKINGFTLVELVITIAIVIILSVVSVPIYRSYIDKAKMSEGYALLGTILSAQKAYYSEYGNFLLVIGRTCYHPVLGVDARGNKYFTYFDANNGFGTANTYFGAAAYIPEDLKSSRNKTGWIELEYNITKGIYMSDEKLDSSYWTD